MEHFCTLFDVNYLVKGVAMIRSLRRNCPGAVVHVLCMDEETHDILRRLQISGVELIRLSDVEDDELRAVKPTRSLAEYCWTLSPCLPWFILQNDARIDSITYVDADLYFFSAVRPLFEEIGECSIAVIEHRFAPRLKHLEVNGRFCVEWVGFRRDAEGMACLSRWREQCIEWCFHRLEKDRMGDQKYLDAWPSRYGRLHILQHPGAGVAPWNYSQYRFESDDAGEILVDGKPLIFYHFHQLQMLSNRTIDRLSDYYRGSVAEPEQVYAAYEAELASILKEVRAIVPGFSGGIRPYVRIKLQRLVQTFVPAAMKTILKKAFGAV
jgi:hypothetical protein